MSTKSLSPDLLTEERYSWVSIFEALQFTNSVLTKTLITTNDLKGVLSSGELIEGYHWKMRYKRRLFHQYRLLQYFLNYETIEEQLLANGPI